MKNWNKDKPKINLIIDFAMLILLMAIAGLGFLIKYILVPGYKRNLLYEGDVELYFMGMDRHEWGSIHLWLSFIFLALMILHIILHWRMITCIFRQMFQNRVARSAIAVFTGLTALFLAVYPFSVKPVVSAAELKHTGNKHSLNEVKADSVLVAYKDQSERDNDKVIEINTPEVSSGTSHKHMGEELDINGYMTLEETAVKFSIPVSEITGHLNIPQNMAAEKIGRLRKMYNFEMKELKDIIISIRE